MEQIKENTYYKRIVEKLEPLQKRLANIPKAQAIQLTALVLLGVAFIAALSLVSSNQDIRQQASVGTYNCGNISDGQSACVNGSILRTCTAGRTTDTNCGSGQQCRNGACQPINPQRSCGGVAHGQSACLDLRTLRSCNDGTSSDTDCSALGQQCLNGACRPLESTGRDCGNVPHNQSLCRDSVVLLSCNNGTLSESRCSSTQECRGSGCVNRVMRSCGNTAHGQSACGTTTLSRTCNDGSWIDTACPANTRCVGATGRCEAIAQPSVQPSSSPSAQPTVRPIIRPLPFSEGTADEIMLVPSVQASARPSSTPTTQPSALPSAQSVLRPITLPVQLSEGTGDDFQPRSGTEQIVVPPSTPVPIIQPVVEVLGLKLQEKPEQNECTSNPFSFTTCLFLYVR